MPELRFEQQIYQVDDFDTVLNTLLKNGHAIPNFCRSGLCHSCMMKAEEGTPLPFTQIGLSDELVAENYFLTCQCAVYAPLTVARPTREKRTRFVAMVREKSSMAAGVTRVLLSPTHEFEYQAGQFTTLINVDGLAADLPIASVHGEGRLMEFHIPRDSDCALSRYIVEELDQGDALEMQTALGDNFYQKSLSGSSLTVIGVDTACASGLSFISKALQEEHQGDIRLVYGQLHAGQEYLSAALEGLAEGREIDCEVITAADEATLLEQLLVSVPGGLDSGRVYVAATPAQTAIVQSRHPDWLSLSVDREESVT